MIQTLFADKVKPDYEALINCIMRKGTPERVHHIELFLDSEVRVAIAERFGIWDDITGDDREVELHREITIQRFLGYDYVRCGVEGADLPLNKMNTEDTADNARDGGRDYVNEQEGPITNWDEFERYPWPDVEKITTARLEWYEKNLPDDMCVIGSGGFAHFAEYLNWLPGYETLCYLLFDDRKLLWAIMDKLTELYRKSLEQILQYNRVKLTWGSDDMGFRTGTLISPDDTREFCLPPHKLMAEMSHAAGRPYLLHSCGKLDMIMDDLIDDVGIDAKHSFEDVIEGPIEASQKYGERIAILGGLDIDFLCRSTEDAIRARVRETLDACMPGGGYVLGTGNSVANYIPLDHYLAMLDEGRKWRG